jgi:Ulp1 family protease
MQKGRVIRFLDNQLAMLWARYVVNKDLRGIDLMHTYQVPQQKNDSDCGFYLIDFIATFLSDPDGCRAAIKVQQSCPSIQYSIADNCACRIANKRNHPPSGGIHSHGEPSFTI